MTHTRVCLLLFILVYSIGLGWTESFKKYDMGSMCGSVLSMTEEEIYGADVNMSLNTNILARQVCRLTFKARADMKYLRFSLLKLDIPNCARTSLTILSGQYAHVMTQFSDVSMICGITTPAHINVSYVSSQPYLAFEFKWIQNVNVDTVHFRVSLNSYSLKDKKDCDGLDEQSCDNGRCIHKNLTCQGFDPCGDKSNNCTFIESNFFTEGKVWEFIPGLIFVILFIGVFCLIRNKERCSSVQKCTECVSVVAHDACSCCTEVFRHVSGKCSNCTSGLRSCCRENTSTVTTNCSICCAAIGDRVGAGSTRNTEEQPAPEPTTQQPSARQVQMSVTITATATVSDSTQPPPYCPTALYIAPPPTYSVAVGDISCIAGNPSDPPPKYEDCI